MIGVLQTIAVFNDSLTYPDLEYLAYQLVKKHGKTTVLSMDNDTIKNEINKIIKE